MVVKRIGIIGIADSDCNKGCEALLFSLVSLLDKYNDEYHHYDLYIINSLHAPKKITIPLIEKEVEVNVLPMVRFRTMLESAASLYWIKCLPLYMKLDCVLAVGLGDSYSDIYGKSNFYILYDAIRFFERLGKPVFFMPQTIGPFSDKRLEKKAGKALRLAKGIFVRDKLSLNYSKIICPQRGDIAESVDMAFSLPYVKRDFDHNTINVGLSISRLLWMNGYTGKNEFGLKTEYKTIVRDIVSYLLERGDVTIHLTPHVIMGSFQQMDDYSVSRDLLDEFSCDRIKLSPYFYSPIFAKNYISGMDVFIGSRMHACIAAFSSGVPTIPMSYSRKFEGLFNETLGYKYGINLTKDTYDTISKISNFIDNRLSIKSEIEKVLNSIVKDMEKNFVDTLQKHLNNV